MKNKMTRILTKAPTQLPIFGWMEILPYVEATYKRA